MPKQQVLAYILDCKGVVDVDGPAVNVHAICNHPDFVDAGVQAARDLRIEHANCRPRPLQALSSSTRLDHSHRVRRARPVHAKAGKRNWPADVSLVDMAVVAVRLGMPSPRNPF